MNKRGGCERFTDFGSKFIRRPSGGLFSVKVVVIKRNANQSLSVTKGKAFYFLFPGTPASLLSGGYARLRRGLPASGMVCRSNKSQTES